MKKRIQSLLQKKGVRPGFGLMVGLLISVQAWAGPEMDTNIYDTTGSGTSGATGGTSGSSGNPGPYIDAPAPQNPGASTTGSSTGITLQGPGEAVPVDQSGTGWVNPVLNHCLKDNTPCPIPTATPGHPYRIFLPGQVPQETTGFYDRNMVWIAKAGANPPANAKFRVEAFFAPVCPSGACVAQNFKLFYQLSALNQPQGEKRILPKNNFSSPKIVTRDDILKNNVQDPLASIMLTGGIHSFKNCLDVGSGSCVIGSSSGGAPVCLNTGNVAAMQSYQGSSYCAIPSGCPAGWSDVGTKDGNNPCGAGTCCQ